MPPLGVGIGEVLLTQPLLESLVDGAAQRLPSGLGAGLVPPGEAILHVDHDDTAAGAIERERHMAKLPPLVSFSESRSIATLMIAGLPLA
jgi:hypothetical protein